MKYLHRNGCEPLDHDPLSERVIGLAINVHKALGPGFPESIYHRAFELELAQAGLAFQSEAPLAVKYRGKVVGTFASDLIIEDKLLVELKALESIPKIAEVQVVSYLKASSYDIGLILNFGQTTLEIKRKYRSRQTLDRDIRLHED